MNIDEATKLLEDHNKWRRGDESLAMQPVNLIGEAIDTVLAHIADRTAGVPHDPRTNGSTEPCDALTGEYACSCGAWHVKPAVTLPLSEPHVFRRPPQPKDAT